MRNKLFILFLVLGILVLVGYMAFVIQSGKISPFAAGSGGVLSLSPSSGNKTVNSIFNVDIIVNTNSYETSGTDVILNYNSADLEVQDDDTTRTGVQIKPGTLYASYPDNRVDATAGKIYFSGITDPGAATGYTGTGTLATVKFKALRVVGSTAVTFNYTPGTTSDSTNIILKSDFTDVLTVVNNATYAIVPQDVTVNLGLTLQARTNFTTTGATLKLFQPGTTNLVYQKTDIATDSAGHASFTITGVPSGNYDYNLKVSYFLTKTLPNISFASPLALNFTAMKAADFNNDNIINTMDFSSLVTKWNQSDVITDVNQDGVVNSADFAVLSSNWFVQGS